MSPRIGDVVEAPREAPVRFTTYLLKIASRCNIACDYCYVYQHNDQSWREQPHLMSIETQRLVVERLAEYATSVDLERILVIFHGGEPLLARPDRLASFADEIRNQLSASQVDFSLQTNGILLDEKCLDTLEAARIGVSLSLDGPAEVNDLHRRTSQGDSTFLKAMDALRRLHRRPAMFTGVISVIDPSVPPENLFDFFAGLNLPALDLLLPDANYTRPPLGRDTQPDLYKDWLLRAFDLWFDHHSTIRLRTFDALLSALVGVPGGTDAFGLGDISLLSIEADGSYHDLDVFKITRHGQTSIGGSVYTTSILAIAASPVLKTHRQLLSLEGLAASCQSCPVVGVCGGGSVPHRYSTDGFDNPTIYCAEMLALIDHAKERLLSSISAEREQRRARGRNDVVDLNSFETASSATEQVKIILGEWRQAAGNDLRSVVARIVADPLQAEAVRCAAQAVCNAPESVVSSVATRPSVILWTRVGLEKRSGKVLQNFTGQPVNFDPSYIVTIKGMLADGEHPELQLHRIDPWLRLPFNAPIEFADEVGADYGRKLIHQAMKMVFDYDPYLAREIRLLSPEIQFIRDNSAHPDEVVSFSDDIVPGALFLGLGNRSSVVDVYDITESLIHEHRHQKLYLLNRRVELVGRDHPLVPSPWRGELRPPSGLLHAAWVFVELRRFWLYVQRVAPPDIQERTRILMETNDQKLAHAWITLSEVELTPAGRQLVSILKERSRS